MAAAIARLACRLRGHRPGPGAAWNHGYCFAHCLRCGTPIMRAVFGQWRPPPRGYRIVWPDRSGRFMPAPAPRAAASGWDFMSEAPAATTPGDRARTAPARDPFAFDDFMDDDPAPMPPPAASPRRRVS